MGTVPESCWYDQKKYSLQYHRGGDKSTMLAPLPQRFARHPQCHISLEMIVVKQMDQSKSLDFNDPRVPSTTNQADSSLLHHMDNDAFQTNVARTKSESDYIYVKPRGWQEIIDPTDNAVVVRPKPQDFKHLPQDFNDISKFEPMANGWLTNEKQYNALNFGPIVGADGAVVYDSMGLPRYHDSFQERDYEDLVADKKPRYNANQYPDEGGKLVEDDTPAYCHQSNAYSENTKFIRFLKKGRYLIGYNHLRIDHCIMGVRYDANGMKRMVSDDRYLIVEVGAGFHSDTFATTAASTTTNTPARPTANVPVEQAINALASGSTHNKPKNERTLSGAFPSLKNLFQKKPPPSLEKKLGFLDQGSSSSTTASFLRSHNAGVRKIANKINWIDSRF